VGQNQRGDGLRHLFFLDEGKRVFSVYKERQDASGIPEVDVLTAKMREFGEGLVVGDQEASKLTDSLKANTYTKLLLPTSDRKQFSAVADSMNLSDRQRKFAQDLGVGEAVVQVGNRSPVPVKLHNYELEKNVTDSELEKRFRSEWSDLGSTPRKRTPEFELEVGDGGGSDEPAEGKEIPDNPADEVKLSESGRRFLRDVLDNPFRSLTDRYSDFSSTYMGNKAKTELIEEGVVFERSVRTGNGQRKLLELTEKGRNHAKRELDLQVEQSGRGGVVHRYWQHRVKEMFEEAGWEAFLETFDADVYVNFGSWELAVEIALGDNPREIEHVEKHLDKGFEAVWVLCRSQDVLEGLKQRLEENGLLDERVVFRLLRELNGEDIPSE
jgi:hypothetical protein